MTISHRTASIEFDIRQLEIFKKVVDLKSFSRAAEAVHLAQASVSERIATLENIIGAKLLDRLGREVVPTKAGELLYKHALLLLEIKRNAVLELQEFMGIKRGSIQIGGSTIPGEYILPGLLVRFQEIFPLVSVVLSVSDTTEIESRVMDGNLELGVVGSKSVHKNLIRHRLWQDELVIAVPAHHRWAERSEVALKEISQEPFILRETGSATLSIMENYLRSAQTEGLDSLNVVARMGTSTAVKEAVKAGLGISILSSRALDTELNAGMLKTVNLKGLKMSRSFYLIRDKRRTASPLARTLFEFLLSTTESV
jgi:DNA-binding transcriptional LysR family regulator